MIEDLLEFGKVQRGILGISALRAESAEAVRKGITKLKGSTFQKLLQGQVLRQPDYKQVM